MAQPTEALLASGTEALQAGDWAGARADSGRHSPWRTRPRGWLGWAMPWWLGEIGQAVAYRQQAYASFRRQPDPARAAVIAMRLCIDHRANFGNPAASGGWLARAARLVDEFDIQSLHGWLLLTTAYDASDPVGGETSAREALEAARRASDLDLELCALSQLGASLVEQGRIEEGVSFLDEAMAGSLGTRQLSPWTRCSVALSSGWPSLSWPCRAAPVESDGPDHQGNSARAASLSTVIPVAATTRASVS